MNTSTLQDEQGNNSNTTHANFIDQLRKVLEILHGKYQSQARQRFLLDQERIKRRYGIRGSQQTSNDLTSEDRLALSGASDEGDDEAVVEEEEHGEIPVPIDCVTNVVRETIARDPTSSYESKRVYDEEDLLFTVDEWLKLKQELHEEIRQIWNRFKQGSIALCVASTTTNAAFELLRQAEEKMSESFPHFNCDYEKTVLPYLKANGKRLAVQQRHVRPSTAILDGPTLDLLNHSMVFAFRYLRGCVDMISETRGTIVDGQFSSLKQELSIVYSSMTFIHEDYLRRILIVFFINRSLYILDAIKAGMAEGFQLDEFARGVGEIVATRKIPAWFVFATEIQVDIHRILGPQAAAGLEELRKTQNAVRNSTTQFQEFLRHQGSPNISTITIADGKKQVDQFEAFKDLCYVAEDLQSLTGTDFKKKGIFHGTEHPNVDTLEHLPIWCVLLQFSILCRRQTLSIIFDKRLGALVPLIYLYDTMRHLGGKIKAWKDIDYMINGHETSYLFFGSGPTSIESYHSRLWRILGWPEGSKRIRSSRKSSRQLNHKFTPLTSVLDKRYCRQLFNLIGKALDIHWLGLANVDRLLKHISDPTSHSRRIKRDEDGDVDFSMLKEYSRSSPSEFLRAFQNQSMSELPHLLSDYFAMIRRAYTLFDDIIQNAGDCQNEEYHYLLSSPLNQQLLVNLFISEWKGRAHRSNPLDPAIKFPMISIVIEAFQRLITREGDLGLKAAEEEEPSTTKYRSLSIHEQQKPFIGPLPPESCRWWASVCEVNNLMRQNRSSWTEKETNSMQCILSALKLINDDVLDVDSFK
ncbi:MAG: hypothetical protein Q9160_005305 [Pyrenula sp. 1 TL-2023]